MSRNLRSQNVTNLALLLLLLVASTAAAEPPTSGFLYQGYLTQSNDIPYDGAFDFELTVFNAPAAGDTVGSTLAFEDVPVEMGLFNVELDFGNDLFTGEALWLEVRVRDGASTGSYTVLSPRQALRLFALNGKEAPLRTPLTGLVTIGMNADEVTGVGTLFTAEIAVGDSILINGEIHTVAQIDNDTRLFLEGLHQIGALSHPAFTDGTLFRVQAGDRSDKLVVDREGVKVGEQGTPTSRILHGTIGDCSSGSLTNTGSLTFSMEFIQPPRVFLSANRTGTNCFTVAATSVSATGFSWISFGELGINVILRPCRCIYWMAMGT